MPIETGLLSTLSRYRWLFVALLLAAGLQALIMRRAHSIHVDGLTFIGIAQELRSDPLRTLRHRDQHPGYPAMILAAAEVLRPCLPLSEPALWTVAALVISGTCGLLSVVALWLLARRLFDEQVANIAAICFAALPLFRMNAADALSDTTHLLVYLTGVWLAAEGFARQRAGWFAAAGLASGAAFWVRPEGLGVALVTGALLCWQMLRRRPAAARSLAAVSLAAMALVGPYMVLAGKFTSKQLPFAKDRAAPVYVVEESQLAARAERKAAIESGAPLPATAPIVSKRVVLRVAGKAISQFVKNIVWGFRFVFLPLYLIGNWELYRRRSAWWVAALPAGLGVLHFLVLCCVYFLSGYIDQRHVMPLVALAMPFAALGVLYIAGLLTRFSALRLSPRAAVAGVIAAACLAVAPRVLIPANPELDAVFLATHWLQGEARPGEGVISNSPFVAFYGQLPGAELTPEVATLDTALMLAPRGARFEFAVLDLQIQGFRPEWRLQIERDYEEVFRLEDPRSPTDDVKVLVYRARHREVAQEDGDRAADGGAQEASRPQIDSGRF